MEYSHTHTLHVFYKSLFMWQFVNTMRMSNITTNLTEQVIYIKQIHTIHMIETTNLNNYVTDFIQTE